NNIQGPLDFVGSGSDSLNVDDTNSATSKTGTLTSSTLTGLGMSSTPITLGGVTYPGGISYSHVSTLNISLGSHGNNFTISSTNGSTSTTLYSGNGNDTVNLTTDSRPTTIHGQNGNDTITVSNDGGATSSYGDSGNDIVNVKAISATTTVNAGNDTDTINVGSNAPNTGGNLAGIAALLTINGDAGTSDVLNVDDSGDALGSTGFLTATRIWGLGMPNSTGTQNGITYGSVESLNIA